MIALPFATPRMAQDATIDQLIGQGAAVAIGVSGGKDSCAAAIATVNHLAEVGHAGPRILIHADLGRTEWQDSLPTCERLADHLKMELVVVRRARGDMLDRWRQRWADNVARWEAMRCVKLILPWSTAAMRFCTAEMKRDVICMDLVRRFPRQAIISAMGIRRDESNDRKNAVTAKANKKLVSVTRKTTGYDWLPIADWTKDQVFRYLDAQGFRLHEAYTKYGSTRVSCVFCILGSRGDMRAASLCEANADVYRDMVDLEIESTFSFQDGGWLADVAPGLLANDKRHRLASSKARADAREAAEARIPRHLLYHKGWPTCVPTMDESALLADVRTKVAAACGLKPTFTQAMVIREGYASLLMEKEQRAKTKS